MLVPSVATRAVDSSDAGFWCCTSHGSVTVAASFHAPRSAEGSSGGGACTVGIASVVPLGCAEAAVSAAPLTATPSAMRRTAVHQVVLCTAAPPNTLHL